MDAQLIKAGQKIFSLRTQMANLKGQEDGLKALFVVHPGETFEFPGLGKISVTKPSEDRTSNEVTYSLNLPKFLLLDPIVQAEMIAKGVITTEARKIKGQPATVRVYEN